MSAPLFILPAHFAPLPCPSPAYGGDPARKAAALDIARNHRQFGLIRQGTYGEGQGMDFRGCDMACMVRRVHKDTDIHEAFAEDYGGTAELAWLYDRLFEALPVEQAKSWPERHLDAVTEGANLSGVMDRWRAWMLRDLLDIPDLAATVRAAVEGMAVLFERRIGGDKPTEEQWTRAAWDARAAWAAGDAGAAWDAWDARAAWAAGDAWTLRATETLLRLLRDCPLVGQ